MIALDLLIILFFNGYNMKKNFHLRYALSLIFIGLSVFSLRSGDYGAPDKSDEHVAPEQPITIEEQIEDIEKIEKQPKKEKDKGRLVYCFGENGENRIAFSIKNRTECFYSKGAALFNKSPLDQVLFGQYTWDFKTEASIGDSVKMLTTARHKGRWGNTDTIARTTEAFIKLGDSVTGKHRHFLGKQILWLRECWVDISINDALCLGLKNRHHLTFGAFSFKLGRGIALGDAYAVNPGLLGFYSNNVIDQYAPGILMHGDLRKDVVSYDIYVGILENLSDSFDNVNEQIFTQQIGKKLKPQRGFAQLNFVAASRLNINLLDSERFNGKKLNFEPYILYNYTPEQDVEFTSDANSKLITVGTALEFTSPVWEFGFEFAQNFGRQSVKCWDRNLVELKRDGSTAALVNSYTEVLTAQPTKENPNPSKALATNKNKGAVNKDVDLGPAFNGQQIGDSGLYNSIDRFRAGYDNIFGGSLIVADASYIYDPTLKFSITGAFASGDEDPNVDLADLLDSEEDGFFSGFIGVQEIYSGKRVPSVFVLGTIPIKRPLSVPFGANITEDDQFAKNTSGFTNLAYTGAGVDWTPCLWSKRWKINPNILGYWQPVPGNKFSEKLRRTINERASSYLGTEINLFADVKALDTLKFFFVGGVFFPGQHYKDIYGKPLDKGQRAQLKDLDSTGFNAAKVLTLQDHYSVIINFGFEFIF